METNTLSIQDFTDRIHTFERELARVVVGQEEAVRGVLAALLADGHVLIEGVPGLGKTLLAKAVSKLIDARFSRIQFTPDLMPSDITGGHVFNMKTREFDFHAGPIFTNVLLADEINRAPAKTHAALLEVMQERRVTVDRTTFQLEWPFFTLATQNPIESEGTYALPAAQLDRFMFKLIVGYLPTEREQDVLERAIRSGGSPEEELEQLKPIFDATALAELRALAGRVTVESPLVQYATELVRATRTWPDLIQGASTRAGIALLKGARVLALLDGRDYVVPDDIQALLLPGLRHRVILAPEAEVEGRDVDAVLLKVRDSVEVPRSR
ncbi:MAG: MoxR family ATPase [Deltaproteobacteria bacterium]|nr:MoxR family ATPase [Deltaproteobacteria bacterium]